MAVAGLKIFKGQNLGLDDGYHVSTNLSKIPTLRGQNRILRGSIPPSLARCNASFPRSRVSLPLPSVLCHVLLQLLQPLDVSWRDRGKLCGAKVKTRENVEKKRYNARDREERAFACRIRDWGPLNSIFRGLYKQGMNRFGIRVVM